MIDETGSDMVEKIMAQISELPTGAPRWPKLLSDMVDVIADSSRRGGMTQDAAAEFARRTVIAMAVYFGGRQCYIPCGDALHRAMRDDRIWREHNGKNVWALAKRHRLSEVSIQHIIKTQRALHTDGAVDQAMEKQGDLF